MIGISTRQMTGFSAAWWNLNSFWISYLRWRKKLSTVPGPNTLAENTWPASRSLVPSSHGIMQYSMLIPRNQFLWSLFFMKFLWLLYLHWSLWEQPKLSTYCRSSDHEGRNCGHFSQTFSITLTQLFCVF